MGNDLDLRGWRRSMQGHALLLVAPDGPHAGTIKIESRLPLRPLAVVVSEVVAYARRVFREHQVEGPLITSTAEGEYAAILNVVGSDGGRPVAQHTACFVFGDTTMAAIEGRIALPDEFQAFAARVALLTREHAMGLGRDRWRRYFYRPPEGWTGVPLVHATAWLHPGYPLIPAQVTVFDARPARASSATSLHNLLFARVGAEFLPISNLVEEVMIAGVPGKLRRYEAGLRRAFDARAVDGRYSYGARLECDVEGEAECLPVLHAILASILPLPAWRDNL